jgi:hypothetical protein
MINLLDVTAIQSSGHERIYGLHDGGIDFAHFFNDADDAEHEILKAKGAGADRAVCYFHGSMIGNMAAGLIGKQTNYDWTRGADGSLTGATSHQAAAGFGLEFCEQLTAGKRTDASAVSAPSSLNGGAASALGLAAYIHVFSLGSGSPTVKIQQSSDDGGGDAFADVPGGSFGVVTAQTSARIVTSLSLAVEQYLRVVTTGTFTNLVFAVCATRTPMQV